MFTVWGENQPLTFILKLQYFLILMTMGMTEVCTVSVFSRCFYFPTCSAAHFSLTIRRCVTLMAIQNTSLQIDVRVGSDAIEQLRTPLPHQAHIWQCVHSELPEGFVNPMPDNLCNLKWLFVCRMFFFLFFLTSALLNISSVCYKLLLIVPQQFFPPLVRKWPKLHSSCQADNT